MKYIYRTKSDKKIEQILAAGVKPCRIYYDGTHEFKYTPQLRNVLYDIEIRCSFWK